MEKLHIDKGDYLTFASIAAGLSLTDRLDQQELMDCMLPDGRLVRFKDIKVPEESRSDISRDGYLGVLFMLLAGSPERRNAILDDIIRMGWRKLWTMGEKGNFDYINIWPLVPLIYMIRYSRFIPTIPTIAVRSMKGTTGFRAHLLALTILIERRAGKKSWFHKSATKKLAKDNPDNLWFRALYFRVHDKVGPVAMRATIIDIKNLPDEGTAISGWGGCPNIIYKTLAKYTLVRL